ncbi:MAG TPA: glycoside hydrolase family 5 protein [Fibrobacteria bacterium]|nr:glycoside hydrolase family 5 protein [Fibrobacteria bacterium]
MKTIKLLVSPAARTGAMLLAACAASLAQTLPTAKSIAGEMGVGWNIGNTMEAPGGPTSWGNPFPTQQLIDSVKASGIKTIRIPCAWDSHANQTTLVIDTAWMSQVKEVVDFCIKDSLFVILNIHWDGGWLENHIDSAVTRPAMLAAMQSKQGAYWKQIATEFRSYDRHLLFASANEPAVDSLSAWYVLLGLHQIFVDTVRATGGNNASRTLVVQGPNTSPDYTAEWMTLPNDPSGTGRLMVEDHFYPYQFCLMTADASWGKPFYYWGNGYHSTTDLAHNPTWGEETYVDSEFLEVVNKFGPDVPVVIGEFGAVRRDTLTGTQNLTLHLASRRHFYNYVVSSAVSKGMIPIMWDAGVEGTDNMTFFHRANGGVYDLGLLNDIRAGAGLPRFPGDTSLVPAVVATGANSMKVLYSAKDSLWGQVNLGVVKPNISTYDSVIVRAYVNGNTTYDSAGTTQNGYVSLSLVTMSNNYTWRECPLGTLTFDGWVRYGIPISTDASNKTALVPADPTSLQFFGLQAYSKAYNGTIYVDFIAFKTPAGTVDTLYSFDQDVPSTFSGDVVAVKSIATSAVPDQEWLTATTGYGSTSIASRSLSRSSLRAIASNGVVRANYVANFNGTVRATLTDLQGQTHFSGSFEARTGANSFEFRSRLHGLGILRVEQGAGGEMEKIYIP